MGWYGKVLGALIGAMVGRGWIGAVIGFLVVLVVRDLTELIT